MRKFNDYLKEQMQNPEFKKEYDNLQPEFDIIRAIVDARTSQNLTQKQLAEKTGIHQADISKLENGTRNPSINDNLNMYINDHLRMYTSDYALI